MEALLASRNALRAQALRDPLTGLLNRRGLDESIDPIVAIGHHFGKPTSLALVDLDHFKQVNDLREHVAGDRLFVDLAECWTGRMRATDLLVRFGGDEFIVVMPTTDRNQAKVLVDRLGSVDSISWSYGIIEVKPRGGSPVGDQPRRSRALWRQAQADRPGGVRYLSKLPGRRRRQAYPGGPDGLPA